MSETEPAIQRTSPQRMLMDALSYPFMRFGWWLLVTVCGCLLMVLLLGFIPRVSTSSVGSFGGIGNSSIYRVFFLLLMAGMIVRSYLSVIENTITGFGEEGWQDSGPRVEGMFADMGTMLGVAAGSWAPAVLATLLISPNEPWVSPVITLLAALGCEYFCMAVVGTVVMGGLQGANPRFVLPAIWRCGGSYALASLVLISVPWGFQTGLTAFEANGGLGGWIAAAAAGAFVLLMQARLVGLIYLANKERIGWE